MEKLAQTTIVIRGAGDTASGLALRLWRAGLRHIAMLELARPMAVRRTVCFSEAVYEGSMQVEELTARLTDDPTDSLNFWNNGEIAVLVDPTAASMAVLRPRIVVDASLSKKNIGMHVHMAPLVLALGPGYTAGKDVHAVIETMRGPHLGRVLYHGSAEPNTGIPHPLEGYSLERVLRAPEAGMFQTSLDIGSVVFKGDTVGTVQDVPVYAAMDGLVRGLLRDHSPVQRATKLGDIDPSQDAQYRLVSDKALAVGGGALEAIVGFLFK